MTPYEDHPTPEKRKEKLLTAFFFSLAVLFFAAAYFPGLPVPWVLQLFSVAGFGACIYLVSRYLVKSFSYRLEESTYGDAEELVIVEKTGKRMRTVCRIAVSDVQAAERITRANRKALLRKTGKGRVYCYQAQMEPTDHCLVSFLEGEDTSYLLISADDGLMDRILEHQRAIFVL